MKLLAFEREIEGITKEEFVPYLNQEAEKVWEYHKNGIIREISFTKESHEAVIILECEDKSAAEALLNELPLVKNGLIKFDVIELIPYNGFERLFKH